jgi:hypothetical protein
MLRADLEYDRLPDATPRKDLFEEETNAAPRRGANVNIMKRGAAWELIFMVVTQVRK